jgi:hypothetical protein
LARLPQGAVSTLSDPFAEKKKPWKAWLLLVLAAAAAVTAWKMGLISLR